jgi:phosphatidate cytidylyltransferase
LIHRDSSGLGWVILLFTFVNIWLADTFAYAFGTWFGQRKLAPQVSPGKTWVGFVFAFPGGLIAALAAYQFLKGEFALYLIVLASLAATLFGQIGDLIESAIKRDCGVKDSSNLIPGHGGVLDRFDSLIFALPAVYLTLKLLG